MSAAALPQVDVAPFDFAPEGVAAALCLHGLTGTPYEVRSLGEALAAAGIRARGPVLPGHDSSPEVLARLPYRAWLDAARRELASLRERHDIVFAVGLSMGGLLSLVLAAEGRVDAVVAIATPLRFRPPLPQLIGIAKRIRPMLLKRDGSDIRDPGARARHPSYPAMPLASVHELIRLQRVARAGLPKIRVPALIAHGAHDQTAAPRDAHYLHDALPGSELLILPHSGHVVPVDCDGPALAAAVAGFLAARCDEKG